MMAYLDPKGEGDQSMPGKRWSCPGVRVRGAAGCCHPPVVVHLEVHAFQEPPSLLIAPSAFFAVRLCDVTEGGCGTRV